MNELFDILEKELDCDTTYIESEIAKFKFYGCSEIFMEAADGPGNADSLFNKVLAKIREIVEKVRETFQKMFQKKEINDSINALDEAGKKDPSVMTKKVKVKDYKKLDELNSNTIVILGNCTSAAQVEATMKKYKHQRNKILAAGAVITISLTACIIILKKSSDKKIEALKRTKDAQEKQINTLRMKYGKAKSLLDAERKKNGTLKDQLDIALEKNKVKAMKKKVNVKTRKMSNAVTQFTSTYEGISMIASAQTEVFKNAAKDCVDEVREVTQHCMDAKNGVSKAASVAKGVSTIKNVGASVVNGEAMGQSLQTKLSESKGRLKKLSDKKKIAENIIKTGDPGSVRYKKASEFLRKAPRMIEGERRVYTMLTQQMNRLK